MSHFVELPCSVFSTDFTLNPYPYLQDLYADPDVLGFTSAGLKFLFKFDDCRALMYGKQFVRGGNSTEFVERETIYAEKYPFRARHFSLDFSHGEPDLQLKAVMSRLISAVTESLSYTSVEAILKNLAQPGRQDDFVEEISKLPLRMFLDVCGLPYEEHELALIRNGSCDFLRAFENHGDESLIEQAEVGVKNVTEYVQKAFRTMPADCMMAKFCQEGRDKGISDERLEINLGSVILMSLSNTLGISASFILRNFIHHPDVFQTFKQHPEYADDENILTELLRLDNHVKALSREATEDTELRGYPVKKGDKFLIFFPGINHDPAHWQNPADLDIKRTFNAANNLVFGGSLYTCIGKKLSFSFLKHMIHGFIQYLPENAKIVEDEIEMDGSWIAERIITKMPIVL